MRGRTRIGIGAACAAVLAATTGTAAASAADAGGATGLAASYSGGVLTASWTPSTASGATAQQLDVYADGTALHAADVLAEPVAAGAAGASASVSLTPGRTYDVVVATTVSGREALSDPAAVAVPAVAAVAPLPPTCTVHRTDLHHPTLSVKVGTPATDDAAGHHAITGSLVTVYRDDERFATHVVLPSDGRTWTLPVRYGDTASGVADYTATVRTLSAGAPTSTGTATTLTSPESDTCDDALLETPGPGTVKLHVPKPRSAIDITWGVPSHAFSPIAKYVVICALVRGEDVDIHARAIAPKGRRHLHFSVGSFTTAVVEIEAVNKRGGRSSRIVVWKKTHGSWKRVDAGSITGLGLL